MKPQFKKLLLFFAFLATLMVVAVTIAQNGVNILDPESWFLTHEAVFAFAAFVTPYITKILTALGKDWFHTDGKETQWLSLGVAVIVAGIGGFLSLGVFAGVSGIAGALNAVVLIVIAFLGSNGMAKNERQAAAAGVVRATEEIEQGTLVKDTE